MLSSNPLLPLEAPANCTMQDLCCTCYIQPTTSKSASTRRIVGMLPGQHSPQRVPRVQTKTKHWKRLPDEALQHQANGYNHACCGASSFHHGHQLVGHATARALPVEAPEITARHHLSVALHGPGDGVYIVLVLGRAHRVPISRLADATGLRCVVNEEGGFWLGLVVPTQIPAMQWASDARLHLDWDLLARNPTVGIHVEEWPSEDNHFLGEPAIVFTASHIVPIHEAFHALGRSRGGVSFVVIDR
mmetsp:Transcript_146937/g.409288  ORF Transcript_146937/g.409288 Transcript_146937/m.409288 type:complete len:246 (-) Transcript_146937:1074-1811(-)